MFFDFAVNKHGMSSTDIYNQLKKLDTVLAIEEEFIKLLHDLLNIKEKSVYVNDCEVPVAKSKGLVLKKVARELKMPELVPSCLIQVKSVVKMTRFFSNQVTADVQSKRENVDKGGETNIIDC